LYSPGGANVPSHEGTLTAHWRHLANTIQLVRPSAHPSLQAKRQIDRFSRFWATVCKTVHPILSVRCLSVLSCPVLSVTFVHCGQTVGRIKTKLGMQVGLGPGHTVLDGDPPPSPLKGHSPPNFRPISVAAKWLHGPRCHSAWS